METDFEKLSTAREYVMTPDSAADGAQRNTKRGKRHTVREDSQTQKQNSIKGLIALTTERFTKKPKYATAKQPVWG